MSGGTRTPVFDPELDHGDLDLGDLGDFAPAPGRAGADPRQVRAVAEPAAFRSREPAPPRDARREVRRHRTGRNVQLNLKVRQQDADAFYALADRHGWVLGEAFQMAVEALQAKADS